MDEKLHVEDIRCVLFMANFKPIVGFVQISGQQKYKGTRTLYLMDVYLIRTAWGKPGILVSPDIGARD